MDWLADATSRACSTSSTASATCCRTSPSSATSRTAASRCSRAERWALTGEAGLFLDPVLFAGQRLHRDRATPTSPSWSRATAPASSVEAHAQLYDQIYHSFYESTLALYTDQYPLFGDPEVLPVKVIWDYTYYWGVLSQIFFQRRLTDLARCSAACATSWRIASGSTSRCRPSCAPGRRAQREAQPGRDARPGRAAVVRRAQPQPQRPARRRRLPYPHAGLGRAASHAGRRDPGARHAGLPRPRRRRTAHSAGRENGSRPGRRHAIPDALRARVDGYQSHRGLRQLYGAFKPAWRHKENLQA